MAASYPTTPVVFPARSDGQTIFSQHINALQDEIAAIEASLVGGSLPNPQKITGTIPTLILDSGATQKARVSAPTVSQIVLAQNLAYTSPNWALDDISALGTVLTLTGGQFYFGVAAAGANPRPVLNNLIITPQGTILERARAVALGEWIDIPVVGSDFTASSGTWTVGGVGYYRYTLIGKTMIFGFYISGTTSTTPTTLGLKIPGGYVAASGAQGPLAGIRFIEGAPQSAGVIYVTGGSNLFTLHKLPVTAIIAGSITVQGEITFEIN